MGRYWGIIRVSYIQFLLLIQATCLVSSIAAAQDATATLNATQNTTVVKTSTEKTEVKRAKRQNTEAKKTNQGIAQGLSVAEVAVLNDNPWGFSLSTAAERGQDELADTWGSSTALDISYSINDRSAVGMSVGYDTILISHDGELFNNESSTPYVYGMSDIELSYSLPSVWSDKYNRLMVNASLTVPTSKTSQLAGLLTDLSVVTSLRYKPMSRVIITPMVGVYGRAYEYETADKFGYKPNSPYGAMYGISGSYIFLSWLTGKVSYSRTERYDYYSDWHTIQSASAQMSATVTDTIAAFAGYRWRDRTISNDALFDDDKSSFFTGVSYAF